MSKWSHTDRILLVCLLIITLWGTYMAGYNNGLNDGIIRTDVSQSKTMDALQLANQYQEALIKCYE